MDMDLDIDNYPTERFPKLEITPIGYKAICASKERKKERKKETNKQTI